MSHQFGNAFIFVRSFFSESFPYREHRVDHSLYGVEVSGGSCRLAFYIVLLKIVVQAPVHALYRPVVAHNGAELPGVCWQATDVQTFFRGVYL